MEYCGPQKSSEAIEANEASGEFLKLWSQYAYRPT